MPGGTLGKPGGSCGVVLVVVEVVVVVTNVHRCHTIMPDGQEMFPMVQGTHILHVGNTSCPSGMIV